MLGLSSTLGWVLICPSCLKIFREERHLRINGLLHSSFSEQGWLCHHLWADSLNLLRWCCCHYYSCSTDACEHTPSPMALGITWRPWDVSLWSEVRQEYLRAAFSIHMDTHAGEGEPGSPHRLLLHWFWQCYPCSSIIFPGQGTASRSLSFVGACDSRVGFHSLLWSQMIQ